MAPTILLLHNMSFTLFFFFSHWAIRVYDQY